MTMGLEFGLTRLASMTESMNNSLTYCGVFKLNSAERSAGRHFETPDSLTQPRLTMLSIPESVARSKSAPK